jgi:chromosomal replication initiation ATPase DnaA
MTYYKTVRKRLDAGPPGEVIDIPNLRLRGPFDTETARAEWDVRKICMDNCVNLYAVRSKSRLPMIVKCRHQIIWVLRNKYHWTTTRIAYWAGYEDHSPVFHACRQVEKKWGKPDV